MALQLTRTTRDRISFHSIPSPFPQIFYFSIPSSPCFVHLKFRSLIIWKRWNESFFFFSSSFLPSVLSTILSIDFVEKNFDIIPFSFLFPLSLFFYLFLSFLLFENLHVSFIPSEANLIRYLFILITSGWK